MIDIPRHDGSIETSRPGPWYNVIMNARRTERVVLIKCPSGHFGYLDHKISADGVVSPSILCSHGCGWHIFGKLEGWTEI